MDGVADIPGFSGYRVGPTGRVTSVRSGTEIAVRLYNGRPQVQLSVNGKARREWVSGLVFRAHVGCLHAGERIAYRDGDPTNVSADNLFAADESTGTESTRKRRLTSGEIAELVTLHNSGATESRLADLFGVDEVEIRFVLGQARRLVV
jgi:hypothetical protein